MKPDAQQFLQQVKAAANLESDREAADAARATLRSLRSVLDPEQRNRLAGSLPAEFAGELGASGAEGGPGDGASGNARGDSGGYGASDRDEDPGIDRETFIGRMMSKLPTEALWDHSLGGLDLVSVPAGDEAARRVQAVFSGIKGVVDTEFAEEIAAALPDEIAEWFRKA